MSSAEGAPVRHDELLRQIRLASSREAYRLERQRRDLYPEKYGAETVLPSLPAEARQHVHGGLAYLKRGLRIVSRHGM